MTALQKLKNKLPQFTWEQKDENIIGNITVPQISKRINKDLYRLNNIHVFISGKMGGTKDNPRFRYAMCYQGGTMRPYRHKIIQGAEYNKLFVSDKNLQGIVNQLVEQIDLNKYFLSK